LAALRQTQAAEAALRRAKGSQVPRVDAFGRYDYDQGWEFNGAGQSYAAGVRLQWDLWDGDYRLGKIRAAQSELESAREQVRKLRLAVDLETHQAELDLNAASERLTVTNKAVEQASESAELTRVRFEQGLALATQVIDAETALVASRVRRAQAEADQRIAVAALRKALGLRQEVAKSIVP
jgi:outer membrane protein TolC